MNERIKKLRRYLNLTQQEFADKIGIKRNTVANYEINRNEPSNAVITLICKTYNIREDWLRNGTGEMFSKPNTFSLDKYAKECGLTSLELGILRGYMRLDKKTRADLLNYFRDIFAEHAEETAEDEIDQEVERYRRELEEEKSTQTLSVSQNTDKKIV